MTQLPTKEGQQPGMLGVPCIRKSQPGQPCRLVPPARGLFPAPFARSLPFPYTAGNCSGLDGISTRAQSYHMFRDPKTLPVFLLGNQTQMGFEVFGASAVGSWTNDHCA